MSIKKYAGEKEIRDKIKELFSYRKLTDLMRHAHLDKDKVFVAQLTDVQYQIYLLDAYLESTWSLEQEKLKELWQHIEDALRKLIPEPVDLHPLLAEIREYERIELNCRRNKWPTREPFKKFYTTKSCDVRLIRHLIYLASPELKKIWKEKAWACYDLITEVNDDITDLQEDLLTYNGNRFLISILRKGIKKSSKRYRDQLLNIVNKADNYFCKHGDKGEHDKLYDWTLKSAIETLELLESTVQKNDHSFFTNSLILSKMK